MLLYAKQKRFIFIFFFFNLFIISYSVYGLYENAKLFNKRCVIIFFNSFLPRFCVLLVLMWITRA